MCFLYLLMWIILFLFKIREIQTPISITNQPLKELLRNPVTNYSPNFKELSR